MLPDKVLSRSVQSTPTYETYPGAGTLTLQLASVADDIIPWGKSPYARDRQLREFWPTEPFLAGAISSTVLAYANASWKIDGPPRTAQATQDMLHVSEMGKGYLAWATKTIIDLLTQDNGAFTELIRESDNENSPVIALKHLDAAQSRRTGIPEYPVIYTDVLTGTQHKMPWYTVITWEVMATPIQSMNGMQYSPLTCVLRAAQILRDISVHKREKVGARGPSSLHLISGVSQSRIEDENKKQAEKGDNMGLLRYIHPTILASLDPNATVSHVEIPIKSLPDGYDEDTSLRWYIVALAMGLGADYQDFAPLPGGGLGSSNQSEILHRKSRGKGRATWEKLITHNFNFHGVMPKSCIFRIDEKDYAAQAEEAQAQKARADIYSTYINDLGIPAQVVYQRMVDAGDLTEEELAMMGQEDVTEDVTVTDESNYQSVDSVVPVVPTETVSPATGGEPAPIPFQQKARSVIRNYQDALIELAEQTTHGAITARRMESIHNSLIDDLAPEAFMEGMKECGIKAPEEEIDSDDQDTIDTWRDGQKDYTHDFAVACHDAIDDEAAIEACLNRVDFWVRSLDALKGLGCLSAKENVVGYYRLGAAEEHCETCRKLNGKKKRMKTWQKSGLLPQQPGNENFDCHGWNCQCTIEDEDGKQLYP